MTALLLHANPKIFVVVGIISTVCAQVFLKHSGAEEFLKTKWVIFLSLSIIFYAVSFVSYYLALKSFEISMVQPIMMASIIVLITIYGYFAGEQFNSYKISGILLACVSILLITKPN